MPYHTDYKVGLFKVGHRQSLGDNKLADAKNQKRFRHKLESFPAEVPLSESGKLRCRQKKLKQDTGRLERVVHRMDRIKAELQAELEALLEDRDRVTTELRVLSRSEPALRRRWLFAKLQHDIRQKFAECNRLWADQADLCKQISTHAPRMTFRDVFRTGDDCADVLNRIAEKKRKAMNRLEQLESQYNGYVKFGYQFRQDVEFLILGLIHAWQNKEGMKSHLEKLSNYILEVNDILEIRDPVQALVKACFNDLWRPGEKSRNFFRMDTNICRLVEKTPDQPSTSRPTEFALQNFIEASSLDSIAIQLAVDLNAIDKHFEYVKNLFNIVSKDQTSTESLLTTEGKFAKSLNFGRFAKLSSSRERMDQWIPGDLKEHSSLRVVIDRLLKAGSDETGENAPDNDYDDVESDREVARGIEVRKIIEPNVE